MKTIRVLSILLLLSLAALFVACGEREDVFAIFRGAYRADVSGEMRGVAFGAVLEADAVDDAGKRTVTLTFYAPSSLSGTVVTRGEDGALSLAVGDLALGQISAAGLLPLFELLPTAGAVKGIELDAAGHSVVTGEGFSLTLLEDGTPIAASNAVVSATIVRFERLDTP